MFSLISPKSGRTFQGCTQWSMHLSQCRKCSSKGGEISEYSQDALYVRGEDRSDQSLVSSNVLGSNNPLQSWVAYQQKRGKSPYPSLKETKNKKFLDLTNRIQPKPNELFHYSCLRDMSEISHWLAFVPYGIDGGAHVNMHGIVYPLYLQSLLDAHGVKHSFFEFHEAVTFGSGMTHVWLRWSDILELQPDFVANDLMVEPFFLPTG
ncbi:hypothetical protein XU18_4032 [Perkinsela sp. CCAP 1560/4]|nr:hypothetical protein XU18_4032 [Perkinsela sp. CCAP 1560/4]|eukprot:KNH04793.1 hypothetical protein XU18_4032 [Perkinsela sp. CCAP 1560/4]